MDERYCRRLQEELGSRAEVVQGDADSTGAGPLFKLIHVRDTLNLLDPNTLPLRLDEAGLADAVVERGGRSFRFRACKPA